MIARGLAHPDGLCGKSQLHALPHILKHFSIAFQLSQYIKGEVRAPLRNMRFGSLFCVCEFFCSTLQRKFCSKIAVVNLLSKILCRLAVLPGRFTIASPLRSDADKSRSYSRLGWLFRSIFTAVAACFLSLRIKRT